MLFALTVLAVSAVVKASPFPQAVTAAISPTGAPPPGCTGSRPDSFGIAVMNITDESSAPAKRQESDGQGQTSVYTMAPVSMIMDGQVQGGMHTMTMMPISQISDGQVQAPTIAPMAPVTVISDGQPQAPVITTTAGCQTPDGQSQASTTPTPPTSNTQLQPSTPSTPSPTAPAASPGPTLVACTTNSTLSLTLSNGILVDAQNRTGYIASNYQFQFDGPPQSGALFTSGFSVCANGSLALGGSNVFYQCLSGSFYNLYDRNWAAQCSAVTIEVVTLRDCE